VRVGVAINVRVGVQINVGTPVKVRVGVGCPVAVRVGATVFVDVGVRVGTITVPGTVVAVGVDGAVGVGVADGRVAEGVTLGLFVGEGARLPINVGEAVGITVPTTVTVAARVAVCPEGGSCVRVGCKIFPVSVAVGNGVSAGVCAAPISGVTDGTGSIS
jgi:hypothetical protein